MSIPTQVPPKQSFARIARNIWLTLLGMFVLLLIIVAVAPCNLEHPEDIAKLDLHHIRAALKLYYNKQRHFPSTKEGFAALVATQNLEKIPTDPWGHEYHYVLDDEGPRVWTNGADGAPGGDGLNAEITMARFDAELICEIPASASSATNGARDTAPTHPVPPASRPPR
ncbi:type II secretion system protein GspG [Corallococcus sp. M34]|uniref:type II secretion system protein GspG n=1 Tax=Citreicoccus inhibens TaxID=2849499 RepID=UPI001C2289EE|nr:type II secretion system protein GspG [Citreicoccus inhibens]MBU8895842.1 type II secretion system protein GspG [Citreicoccus inhibens]